MLKLIPRELAAAEPDRFTSASGETRRKEGRDVLKSIPGRAVGRIGGAMTGRARTTREAAFAARAPRAIRSACKIILTICAVERGSSLTAIELAGF